MHPEDAEFISSRVRFMLKGDEVKILLPEGVSAFSNYERTADRPFRTGFSDYAVPETGSLARMV